MSENRCSVLFLDAKTIGLPSSIKPVPKPFLDASEWMARGFDLSKYTCNLFPGSLECNLLEAPPGNPTLFLAKTSKVAVESFKVLERFHL